MLFASPLRRGDRVTLVAPSSPFDRTLALRGAAWLGERYRVAYGATVFARSHYLAGDDDRRLAELQTAFTSDAQAIVAMRGGYGLSRIIDRIDWSPMMARPCWLIGFSDITVLHVEASRRGIASIHAPMVCALGRGDGVARSRWCAHVEDPLRRHRWEGLAAWRGGTAEGPVFGGNLTILHSCAARGRLRIPVGAVVILEDVGERPYRVDRMLSDLIAAGHFANAGAVVVGEFTDCVPGRDGRTVEAVLQERLEALGIPVIAGAPVGHGQCNEPFTMGVVARVDAQGATSTCTFG